MHHFARVEYSIQLPWLKGRVIFSYILCIVRLKIHLVEWIHETEERYNSRTEGKNQRKAMKEKRIKLYIDVVLIKKPVIH